MPLLLDSFPLPGTLGNVVGVGSDGVLIGSLTAANPTKALLKAHADGTNIKAFQDDGGAYTAYSTEIAEATADDVPVLPATPANDDAFYFGHDTATFAEILLECTTQGAGTWTITWQYWDGDAWQNLSGVTDGTSGFTAATGTHSVSFTLPGDWEQNTVDSVECYWVRAVVSGYSAVTTQPLYGQGWAVLASADAAWTDDTTDFTDAGAGDVDALPAMPVVGDGLYIGYGEKFCKVKATVSQARTGTATLTWKYWNGSAWTNLSVVEDDSAGWSTGTSTYLAHFEPPSDWVANTAGNGPNGQTGFFVVCELTAKTTVTAQPQITQGWVYPLVTGASGIPMPVRAYTDASMCCRTNAGAAADSKFLIVNVTSGAYDLVTWTKATGFDTDTISLSYANNDELAIVQITEDGTAEIADGSMHLGY